MDNRKKKGYEVVDWIFLPVDKNRWQTRVKRVMNFQAP